MRTLLSFTAGAVLGAAVGTLVGVVAAEWDAPHQQTLREFVTLIRTEAQKAAQERRAQLQADYARRVGGVS